jgi:hypothetical protein
VSASADGHHGSPLTSLLRSELEALVDDAAQTMPAVEVQRHASGWERGNWWGVWDVREAAR